MTTLRNKYYSTLGHQLVAAVADDATFEIAYPSGTTVGLFDKGLTDLTDCYVHLNKNDRWALADPGINLSFGASVITVTNRSGYSWPAGTIVDLHLGVKEGNRRLVTMQVPPMAGWTAADIITEMQPGIDGTLEYAEWVQTVAVTTAGDGMTLNFEIDTTNVTSMTLALTSDNATPKGIVLPFALPTAANTLTRASKLSLEAATSVATFAEGEGYINLYIRESFPDQY
jgi:hypothetical protein